MVSQKGLFSTTMVVIYFVSNVLVLLWNRCRPKGPRTLIRVLGLNRAFVSARSDQTWLASYWLSFRQPKLFPKIDHKAGNPVLCRDQLATPADLLATRGQPLWSVPSLRTLPHAVTVPRRTGLAPTATRQPARGSAKGIVGARDIPWDIDLYDLYPP